MKSRQRENGNGGNTGIHGKRTRWGSIAPKELERDDTKTAACPSAPAARRRWSNEEHERVERMGMGEKDNSPCPDITSKAHPAMVVPLGWAVVLLDEHQR